MLISVWFGSWRDCSESKGTGITDKDVRVGVVTYPVCVLFCIRASHKKPATRAGFTLDIIFIQEGIEVVIGCAVLFTGLFCSGFGFWYRIIPCSQNIAGYCCTIISCAGIAKNRLRWRTRSGLELSGTRLANANRIA